MANATISPAIAAAMIANRTFKDENPADYKACKAALFAQIKASNGIPSSTHVKVEIDDRDDPDYLVVKGRRDDGSWGYIDADTGEIRDEVPLRTTHQATRPGSGFEFSSGSSDSTHSCADDDVVDNLRSSLSRALQGAMVARVACDDSDNTHEVLMGLVGLVDNLIDTVRTHIEG